MRDLLRKRGVYVRKMRWVLISEALIEVVKEHIPRPQNMPKSTYLPHLTLKPNSVRALGLEFDEDCEPTHHGSKV